MSTVMRDRWAKSLFMTLVGAAVLSWPASAAGRARIEKGTSKDRREVLRLDARVGLGWSASTEIPGTAAHALVGGSVRYSPVRRLELQALARGILYSRTYLSNNVDPEQGSAQQVTEREDLVDLGLSAGYEIVSLFKNKAVSSVFAFSPTVGYRVLMLRNESFGANMGGVSVGAKVALRLSGRLGFEMQGQYVYNFTFSHQAPLSLLGAPRAAVFYGAGLVMRFRPGFRLGLGYDGMAIVFNRDYRFYHSLSFRLTYGL